MNQSQPASHHPPSCPWPRGRPGMSTNSWLYLHLPWCRTRPLVDTIARLGLEEPGVSWTCNRSRWPVFCPKKWGVNLLSLTLKAEQWLICLKLGIWPPRCCRCILQRPMTKFSLPQVPFRPCFPSCKSLQHNSTAAFPVPSYILPGDMVYMCFVSSYIFLFPGKHLKNAVACRDRTDFCIFSIV